MIIFGSRTRSSLAAALFFTCAICHVNAAQRLFRVRTWFTLFFAPVFPFGHGRYLMQCAHCGNGAPLSREGAERFIADSQRAQADRMAQETLGRPAETDLDLLGELEMPIKALNATL